LPQRQPAQKLRPGFVRVQAAPGPLGDFRPDAVRARTDGGHLFEHFHGIHGLEGMARKHDPGQRGFVPEDPEQDVALVVVVFHVPIIPSPRRKRRRDGFGSRSAIRPAPAVLLQADRAQKPRRGERPFRLLRARRPCGGLGEIQADFDQPDPTLGGWSEGEILRSPR